MPRSPLPSRRAILSAAERLLKIRGASATTVEAVARQAGCAKGLVHYHFKTKSELLAAVAEQLALGRSERWARVLEASSGRDAVARSWALLRSEAGDGTVAAWISLLVHSKSVTDRTVNNHLQQFDRTVARAVDYLLGRIGLRPTVPANDIGALVTALIHGTGVKLVAGTPGQQLEGAYTAGWAGVISLTSAAS